MITLNCSMENREWLKARFALIVDAMSVGDGDAVTVTIDTGGTVNGLVGGPAIIDDPQNVEPPAVCPWCGHDLNPAGICENLDCVDLSDLADLHTQRRGDGDPWPTADPEDDKPPPAPRPTVCDICGRPMPGLVGQPVQRCGGGGLTDGRCLDPDCIPF